MLGETIGLTLSGRTKGKLWRLWTSYAHNFGAARPRPNRLVWDTGWERGSRGWSLTLQIYRPGMELDWHQDGSGMHNFVWSVVLKQPKGGVLEVDGPHKHWGRFHFFDGGLFKHRVTKCEGYRIVLMFQRMKKLERKKQHD